VAPTPREPILLGEIGIGNGVREHPLIDRYATVVLL
jgi:hypothetical protein